MTDTLHNKVLELIPAYSLNCLDADEREQVVRHLPDCKICQAELRAYQSVTDQLPLGAPEPSPDPKLKQRLLARISTSSPQSPSLSWWERLRIFTQKPLSVPRWGAAALALILLAIGNIWLVSSPQTTPGEIVLAGTRAAPKASGLIVVGENSRLATLIVENLPPLDPQQQYQFWLIEDDGTRISGGVFSVNSEGYHSIPIDASDPLIDYDAFGITIEPEGGSIIPTGDRVLEYDL